MKKATMFFTILILAMIPLASAGLQDFWNKFTGKATSQPVELEILIGGGTTPIINVLNNTMTDVSFGVNEGPSETPITLQFLAFDAEGSGNLNDSTAKALVKKAGEETRISSCTKISSNQTTSTYECSLNLYWWDAPGTWTIEAEIKDINNNLANDQNKTFQVGATSGFVAAPLSIAWQTINPGSTQISAEDSIILNNTGNLARNIQVNSTHLRGLVDNTRALYAGNFSINTANTCGGTSMEHLNFVQIAGANLARGNFTKNDLSTGQEEIFFCLEQAGSELTQQSYSTAQEGAWTMKITA